MKKTKRKNPAAVALGAKGGKKRAQNHTKKQLRQIALLGWVSRRTKEIAEEQVREKSLTRSASMIGFPQRIRKR